MEFVRLTKRLQTVAEMIKTGNTVADIGTDHGYLPIYLIQNNIAKRVIAMDVRKGPLNKAIDNINQYKLSDNIETRLSDGLNKLMVGEAQSITICGMGGKLITKILEQDKNKLSHFQELILSPQSELLQFREYLRKNHYIILKEDMVIDDGKYYVIIKCVYSNVDSTKDSSNDSTKDSSNDSSNDSNKHSEYTSEISINEIRKTELYDKFGKYLLEHKNIVLKEYLLNEQRNYIKIIQHLKLSPESKQAEARIKEIDNELYCIQEGLQYYEM